MSTPAPSQRLGPYELIKLIGKGGMGEVWQARDTRLKREVAIKFSEAQFTDRFHREAQAIAALNHPNICTLYDVGPNYLVMELIEGPTLADRIKEAPIPVEEALAIARQMANALEAAHEKNIVHRDLKPGNIKVRPDGSVKVLDFGLAKAGAAETPVTHDSPTLMQSPTMVGLIVGTAAYMAPEQARGKAVDKRADIWAFGVVFWELLTGEQLFQGETITDVLAAVVRHEPEWSRVPVRLRRLLRKCLAKEPKNRLRDIGDAWDLLEEPSPPPLVPPPGSSRFQWAPWITASAMTVLAAGLALVHFREPKPEQQVLRYTLPPPEKATSVEQIAISPDGRYLAIIASGAGGGSQLWVRAMDSLQMTALSGTAGASYAFWSPDSSAIGFFAQGKLEKVAVTGGPVQTLCAAATGRGATWSKDGVILFAPTNNGGLSRVPATGGVPAPVTKTNNGSHRSPVFLPDGRRFLYVGALGTRNGIFLASLDQTSGGGRLLMTDVSLATYFNGYILFLRGSTLMAQPVEPKTLEFKGDLFPVADEVSRGRNTSDALYTVSDNGTLIYKTGGSVTRQLRWFDRAGAELRMRAVMVSSGGLSILPSRRMAPA